MAVNGTQILLLAKTGSTYTAIAEQTGLSLESSSNLIEVSSKNSNHTKFIYGREDDTLSLEALYVPGDAGLKALTDSRKNRVPVVIRQSENGVDVEEAQALVEKISVEYPDDDVATVSVDLQLIESWHVPTA